MLDSDDFLSVTMLSKTNSSFQDIIQVLNSVVVVLVISAAVLGFVVLYNLSAINISERIREIATLKVLGLYPGEVTGYIGRESAILTLLGTLIGLLAGMGLHRYIMDTIEVDFAMFGKEIQPLSYLYAFGLTLVFAAIVQVFVHFSLKKVKMVESLKSVE